MLGISETAAQRQQQETLSASLYPATRGGFSPSPHRGRWVPWTAFPWQWWIAPFIRSHSVQKSMQALKNVSPLCRHIVFARTKRPSQLHPLQRVQTQDVNYIANLRELLSANFKEIWTLTSVTFRLVKLGGHFHRQWSRRVTLVPRAFAKRFSLVTLVTATLAPLLISCTTFSTWPL